MLYQGLINGIQDVDSIFLLTNLKINKNLNINFLDNYPLLYLPGNYVPINSKIQIFHMKFFLF